MEDLIAKTLISVGSSGITCGILWVIANRFMNETVKQMDRRIEALEKASAECAEDRRRMHEQIVQILRDK